MLTVGLAVLIVRSQFVMEARRLVKGLCGIFVKTDEVVYLFEKN